MKGEDVHTRHEECEKEEVIRVGVEDLHREDASRPEDTFLSDIQVGGQVTVCVPVERENPETVTKTWAEEVEEVYPVSDDNLNHFPDSFVGKCTDEMQCSGNEGKKQASPTPPPEEACVCVCEETQPKVTISVNTSNISDDHVVTESVYIEPKYHFQAIGINQCVLSALEKIYNVKAIFNDANNKIIIHGVSKNVKPCKEDVEFNMSVRRWWDQEPNKAAPLPNTYYKYNDIRQGSSHANLNTVETFTTCHTDVVIETVYIEPKYHFQAIGIDNCVLKALETIYKVKIVFNEFNNKICIQGSQKQVKLCKEDIEFNMSVRRWWDEEHTDAAPLPITSTQLKNASEDTTPSVSRQTTAAKEEESITSRVPSELTYKYMYNDIRQGSSQSNLNTVETFTTCHTDVVIETVYIEPKYHFQAIGIDNCVLKALETIYKVKIVFNEFNNKICIQGSQKQVKLCKEDIEFNMSVRRWWDEEHTDTPPNTSTQHQKENTCDDAASQDYHDAASQDYYQCYEITNDDAASQDYYQCYENTCDDTASQHYYRCYESTNDDAASQNYYQYYESSSQYEAARSYYQYYESTDHYAASRQYYCDYDSTKQNEGARDYYCYYDCTNDYADARDYYR